MKNQLDILKLHTTKGRKPDISQIKEEIVAQSANKDIIQEDSNDSNTDREDI